MFKWSVAASGIERRTEAKERKKEKRVHAGKKIGQEGGGEGQ